jgi:hypothetical protein
MKKQIITLTFLILSLINSASSQTATKEHKAGHVFYVSLPDYLNKTTGLNDAATIQFKNEAEDIAGFVIEDTKESLTLPEMSFATLKDFFDQFIKDFLLEEKNRKISPATSQTKGSLKLMECDASYYDNDLKTDIYYFVGVAETKDAYYKVFCFCALENKDKYKADFQKILYSLRD